MKVATRMLRGHEEAHPQMALTVAQPRNNPGKSPLCFWPLVRLYADLFNVKTGPLGRAYSPRTRKCAAPSAVQGK